MVKQIMQLKFKTKINSPRNMVIISMLAFSSLFLSACMQDVSPEFNVAEREQVVFLNFKLNNENEPIIMAQVGMNYRSKTPEKGEAYQGIVRSNEQSILFTRKNGGWQKHPFRNLQKEGSSLSRLLVNGNGGVQPMVYDYPALSLYAEKSEGWIVKKRVRLQPQQFGGGFRQPFATFLVGDSAWQDLDLFWSSSNRPSLLKIIQPNHADLVLDSNVGNLSLSTLSTPDFNLAIFREQGFFSASGENGQPEKDSLNHSRLLVYSWGLNAIAPKSVKQILPLDKDFTSGFFAKVMGEHRFYGIAGSDHLLEFTLKGRELIFLKELSVTLDSDLVESQDPNEWYYNVWGVDKQGCAHRLKPWRDKNELLKDFYNSNILGYIHTSSCYVGIDTLFNPAPLPIESASLHLSEIHFTEDGTLNLAAWIEKRPQYNTWPITSIEPSWIYFGKLPKGGKWEWEKVAEY